ncbi:uncharacterized protein LOC122024076 isoform X1 [Zingiber officinale]|uniref:uncharacterized protein LOC122024076 isoform X1 n=1 Tax=Zingiber officinale TaxID=94328 RepID=UPI001C4B532E|nr:uncharacterized protein LOC122024076 isoform X1 [Zingiber officinale]XP_042438545.1 uncharacterized protein LOC122024076 isoform X1 [Zingiber officinale]XP_042438546.1 uncharacterized protein LOC122024076 isoform X1 [Zingiber officinale]XP_042438547.1 uncharacterized protein LOC122024076 isoform X1 [Zingiber officinale]XP_042438548.1 uncharacterized protein LOC122024076 isoform X1 [Zingiber officinale]XP_042438550.1 uncharacterized protein LOC122024076 isoform X1 [Zingiber officinale]
MAINFHDVRGLLAAFSPSSEFFAISSGDGRIKIWDTIKGQLQTEFSDLSPSDASSLLSQPKSGHLSLDYTCMKWVPLERKKKRKSGSSLLVLGTGNGDVLALDVSAGQLKWKISDCHPGGVNAVCFSEFHRSVYTTGVDGMVCEIDAAKGSLIGKFRAFTKSISSMAVSADGKILATASGQLKTFGCSDNKKLQKFSGHPVAVRCMIFSQDGQYIMTSGVGERHIAIWKVGGDKKQSASCILSMEHPAVFLDGKDVQKDEKFGEGFSVLAISEVGMGYFWYGSNLEELRHSQPTKISVFMEPKINDLGIYGAKLLDSAKAASGHVFLAYGSLVKPSFQKLLVHYGTDIKLDDSKGGILLPIDSFPHPQKPQMRSMKGTVTALDRTNAEHAVLPIPKLHTHDKKRKHSMAKSTADIEDAITDPIIKEVKKQSTDRRVVLQRMEKDTICLEDKLRELGFISDNDCSKEASDPSSPTSTSLDLYSGDMISSDAKISSRKIRLHVSSMNSADAYNFLEDLISAWRKRTPGLKNVLQWIYYILLMHGQFVASKDSSAGMLDGLQKASKNMIRLRCASINHLLKLSGRIRLIMTQIDKIGKKVSMDEHLGEGGKMLSDDDEDVGFDDENNEDEEIDEMLYGEDESNSDDDDDHELGQT